MATYEFQAEDGEIVEVQASMNSPMSTRMKITRKGKVFLRVLAGNIQATPEFKEYESFTVPKGMPGCPVNPKTGRTIITSRAEEKRVAEQRTGLRPSQQEWN